MLKDSEDWKKKKKKKKKKKFQKYRRGSGFVSSEIHDMHERMYNDAAFATSAAIAQSETKEDSQGRKRRRGKENK